jgi:hypothetical protein
MSCKVGKLYTCDRCGAEAFCAHIGKGEADGGFTTWNVFDPLPKGWKEHGYGIGTLCPTCSAVYADWIERFMVQE